MERTTVTIDITVAGETRPVQFSFYGPETAGFTRDIFTGQIGRGVKRHACAAHLWQDDDEQRARRRGFRPGETYRQGSDGHWYCIQLSGHTLNRPVRITGWRDASPHTSRHIMERASR